MMLILHDLFKKNLQESFPSLTIQVSTEISVPEKAANIIKIKDAVKQAYELLQKEAPDKAELLFAKLADLVTSIDDIKPGKSLLILVSQAYAELIVLPFSLPDLVVVSKRFELRDVLTQMPALMHYWVLALAEKPTRLFRGYGKYLDEIIEPAKDRLGIERDGFPYEYLGPQEHQYDTIETGDKDARYFDEHRKKFFHKIDHLLHKFVGQSPLPLIVVGDKDNVVVFNEISKHKNLIIANIHGSHSTTPAYQLSEIVWPALESYQKQQQRDLLNQFIEAIGREHHAFGLEWVWRVAREGRIKDLLLEENFKVPGIINPEPPYEIIKYEKPQDGVSPDIVQAIIDEVIAKRGKVTVFESDSLKDYQHIAAILRY